MGEIKGFILALCAASAASALIEGLIPEGGTKKYVNYLVSLTVLLVLLSPLAALVKNVPPLLGRIPSFEDSVAATRAEEIVAERIKAAVCEKFSLGNGQVHCVWNGKTAYVRLKKTPWILVEDVKLFILYSFGVEAEVELNE